MVGRTRSLRTAAQLTQTALLASKDPLTSTALIAQQAQKPPMLEMPDATRAKVLAVLTGLVILGFAMIALTWLGGRMTRRYMNQCGVGRRKPSVPRDDDWAEKPLNPDP